MAITASDIVTLQPERQDIADAVRYAIKSGVHTYDRMNKDAWRRVARIARGKVNESIVRRHAEQIGLATEIQDKSYRNYDAFDFTFNGRHGALTSDVKTFHILSQFVRAPRGSFTIDSLFSGVGHDAPDWHLFFPMLIPADYRHNKDITIFAISVEDVISAAMQSPLDYPWSAFPDQPGEDFMVNPSTIKGREASGLDLAASVGWPEAITGSGNAIFERSGEARQRAVSLPSKSEMLIEHISSFLAIQVDDEAYDYLKRNRAAIRLSVQEGEKGVVEIEFMARRFREVFPRQNYTLHLIGWISKDEFTKIAQTLPAAAPCYFYPPKQDAGDSHQPGTKTANRYVLPASLQPIHKLTEV